MHISSEEFLHFASTLEGERITTAGGRASFTVRVLPMGLEITPDSSRKPRFVRPDKIQAVLNEYEQSRKLQPGQYQSVTFDSSYLLGIVARLIKSKSGA